MPGGSLSTWWGKLPYDLISVQVDGGSEFRDELEDHPKVIWHIAQILGLRIFNLNQYLVDLKHKDQGQDHLQMVEDVLGVLLDQTKTF